MSSSKFFSTGDSDYSSASESSGSESEVEIQALGGSQQVRLVYSSSESEEEKRVVKTAKEKHFEALLVTTKAMKHHVQIADWTAVAKDLDGLLKQADKAKTVFNKEGKHTHTITHTHRGTSQ
jgi:translation initiation factor 3 subunit C